MVVAKKSKLQITQRNLGKELRTGDAGTESTSGWLTGLCILRSGMKADLTALRRIKQDTAKYAKEPPGRGSRDKDLPVAAAKPANALIMRQSQGGLTAGGTLPLATG